MAAKTIDNSAYLPKDHADWDLTALKRSIPEKYFVPNTSLSMYYAIRSLVLVTLLGVSYYYALKNIESFPIRVAVSLLYWFCQGTVFWGIFTIGHDCGHRSFSSKQWLNDLVGTIWHGLILVPYYPWKVSHAHHHKNTGNVEIDEIFYPIKESEAHHLSAQAKMFMQSCFFFGVGWMAYLISGYPGINYQRTFGGEMNDGPCHFNPKDKMFRQNLFLGTTSVGFVYMMLAGCVVFSFKYSFLAVAQYYLIPIFVFGSYLVMVTFLHHAADNTLWLAPEEWNYSRGQLMNTVDRDYGAIINNISHNIGTHVLHHLFPVVAHYNLVEASKHLKEYTKKKGLPYNEAKDEISTLATFVDQTSKYAKNYTMPENAVIYSVSQGQVVKSSEKKDTISKTKAEETLRQRE